MIKVKVAMPVGLVIWRGIEVCRLSTTTSRDVVLEKAIQAMEACGKCGPDPRRSRVIARGNGWQIDDTESFGDSLDRIFG